MHVAPRLCQSYLATWTHRASASSHKSRLPVKIARAPLASATTWAGLAAQVQRQPQNDGAPGVAWLCGVESTALIHSYLAREEAFTMHTKMQLNAVVSVSELDSHMPPKFSILSEV